MKSWHDFEVEHLLELQKIDKDESNAIAAAKADSYRFLETGLYFPCLKHKSEDELAAIYGSHTAIQL